MVRQSLAELFANVPTRALVQYASALDKSETVPPLTILLSATPRDVWWPEER